MAFFSHTKTVWRAILTGYKMNKGKKVQTIPKDTFPKLLKKLMETPPDQAENTIADFDKCGIYPLDPTYVLERLPDTCTDSKEDVSNFS